MGDRLVSYPRWRGWTRCFASVDRRRDSASESPDGSQTMARHARSRTCRIFSLRVRPSGPLSPCGEIDEPVRIGSQHLRITAQEFWGELADRNMQAGQVAASVHQRRNDIQAVAVFHVGCDFVACQESVQRFDGETVAAMDAQDRLGVRYGAFEFNFDLGRKAVE